MTIAPIRQTVEVRVPPERAFALFTGQIGRWWPRGKTVGKTPHADIVVEPREGGRWFERGEDGAEADWGHVLAWEPPERVLLAWQLDASWTFDPALVTEVEVTFRPQGAGTAVTLEHRRLERFGPSADALRASLGSGWPGMLGHFADYARSQE